MLSAADQVPVHHHVLDLAASDDPGTAERTTNIHHCRYGGTVAGHGRCRHDGRFGNRSATGEEIFGVYNASRNADQLVPDQVLDLGGGDHAVPIGHDRSSDDRLPDSVHGAVFDLCFDIPGELGLVFS